MEARPLSPQGAVAGLLGGATVLGDLAVPGMAPLVDLVLGAAIAGVAAGAAWTRFRGQDSPVGFGRLLARTLGSTGATPAGALLGLALQLTGRRDRIGLRAARWVGRALRLVATATLESRASRRAPDAVLLVEALEDAVAPVRRPCLDFASARA